MFCPSCGAPQIRVTAPVTADESYAPTPPPPFPAGVSFTGSERTIDWKAFARIALPLAFLAGTVCGLFLPLGLALIPGGVVLGIARYRRDYAPRITPSQGGWLGAFTGLLSFVFFLIFAGIRVYLKRDEARVALLSALQEQAARNPDPNAHQVVSMLATPAGLVVMFLIISVIFLAVFVALATVSGVFTAAISGNRNRG